MAKRPRVEPPGIDWNAVGNINRSYKDSFDDSPGSTPAPPPAPPVRPPGALPPGFKSDEFTFNKGGRVRRYCKGGKVISTRSF